MNSLPTPYYDQDGITIYNAVIRVNCMHGRKRKSEKIQGKKTWRGCAEVATWSQAWVQAVARSHCKAHQVWGRASCMERRGRVGTYRAIQGTQMVCAATMRNMRSIEGRAPSSGRQHFKQLSRQYSVPLSKMSHEGGRAI